MTELLKFVALAVGSACGVGIALAYIIKLIVEQPRISAKTTRVSFGSKSTAA